MFSDLKLMSFFSFFIYLHRNNGNELPKPLDVINLLQSWYGKNDAADALEPKSDYDDLRKICETFITLKS